MQKCLYFYVYIVVLSAKSQKRMVHFPYCIYTLTNRNSVENHIQQQPEPVQKVEELPRLRKVEKPKEEPKKEEVKRTKVKLPKAKKYEELPEIPDYERPELEIYEESEFDPTKQQQQSVPTPVQLSEKGVEGQVAVPEPTKNGLPKVNVCFVLVSCSIRIS